MKLNRPFIIDSGYLLFLIFIFALFVSAAFFTHPCYDDFSFSATSATSATRPILEDWKIRCFGWSGRYFFYCFYHSIQLFLILLLVINIFEIKKDRCDNINESYTRYFHLKRCTVGIKNNAKE